MTWELRLSNLKHFERNLKEWKLCYVQYCNLVNMSMGINMKEEII